MSELLPCPFCGGEAMMFQEQNENSLVNHFYNVSCRDENCVGYSREAFSARKKDSIQAWNRRTTPPANGVPEGWQKVTKVGQIEKGDWISFRLGKWRECARVEHIAKPGSDDEEIIYDIRRNYYFITSRVINGTSNHNNVFVLASTQSAKAEGISD